MSPDQSASPINQWHHWLSGADLMYMHDDSENMEDSFTIELTDGKHRLQRQVMVKVLPVNDEEPRVIRLDFHLPAMLKCHMSECGNSFQSVCFSETMDWKWSQEKPGSYPALRSLRRTAIRLPQRSCTYLRAFLLKDYSSLRLVQRHRMWKLIAKRVKYFSRELVETKKRAKSRILGYEHKLGRCCIPNHDDLWCWSYSRKVRTGWRWNREETVARRRWTWTFFATSTRTCTALKHKTSLSSTCRMERINHHHSTFTSLSRIYKRVLECNIRFFRLSTWNKLPACDNPVTPSRRGDSTLMWFHV